MIETTDEMVQAYDEAAWKNPVEFGGVEMANVHEGLTAVLALVERDYALVDRTLAERPKCPSRRWGLSCYLHDGHNGRHTAARFEEWA